MVTFEKHQMVKKKIKSPKTCDYCEKTIWGFSKSSLNCKVCHIYAHPSCKKILELVKCPHLTPKIEIKSDNELIEERRVLSHVEKKKISQSFRKTLSKLFEDDEKEEEDLVSLCIFSKVKTSFLFYFILFYFILFYLKKNVKIRELVSPI